MQDISSYKNVMSVNSQERIDILAALERIKTGVNNQPVLDARAALERNDKDA